MTSIPTIGLEHARSAEGVLMADGQCALIRADADTRMGTGHVMRCVARPGLGKTGGPFATASITPARSLGEVKGLP